ncbi:hypothetical protein V3C99_006013 [Haemonchus contortus]
MIVLVLDVSKSFRQFGSLNGGNNQIDQSMAGAFRTFSDAKEIAATVYFFVPVLSSQQLKTSSNLNKYGDQPDFLRMRLERKEGW